MITTFVNLDTKGMITTLINSRKLKTRPAMGRVKSNSEIPKA